MVKECARTVQRRRDSIAIANVVARLSGSDSLSAQVEWLTTLDSKLKLAQRKSRRFQAELLLAIDELEQYRPSVAV